MKSAILKNHILHFAAMFVVLIAGLSFVSCASESGEDQEASPIVDTWRSQASSTGTYYMVFTEYKEYFVTTDLNDQNFRICHHFPRYYLKSAELYRKNNLFFDRTSIFKYHAENSFAIH